MTHHHEGSRELQSTAGNSVGESGGKLPLGLGSSWCRTCSGKALI